MKIIVALLIFMPLVRAQSASAPRPFPQSVADWQTMIPAIREALKAKIPDERIEQPYAIGIIRSSHVADVTGDGVSEALVFFGTGGASTNSITLVRMEAGKPVVALFKGRDGKTHPMVFVEGASVMHTDGVELLPQERAVYSLHYNYHGSGELHQCGGEAFRWNSQTKTFDYNARLSTKVTKESCRKVPKTAW